MILLYDLKRVYTWDEFTATPIFFNKGVINIPICRILIHVMYIIVSKSDNEIDKM